MIDSDNLLRFGDLTTALNANVLPTVPCIVKISAGLNGHRGLLATPHVKRTKEEV